MDPFQSFVRDGLRFNCYIIEESKNRKGYLVKYHKSRPSATSFYDALDRCRVQTNQFGKFIRNY